ncbi:MAG: hypothetical protein OXH03_11385, partial [Bacteroidetes bacterium]|nr:hypothetical protein [Bacteroidota bacterium]MDE2671463.1 hypothetical protein [Bacteroidota bacterium]
MRVAEGFLLEVLPGPCTITVGSHTFGQNHELVGIGVPPSAFGIEPVHNTIHRKLWRIAFECGIFTEGMSDLRDVIGKPSPKWV